MSSSALLSLALRKGLPPSLALTDERLIRENETFFNSVNSFVDYGTWKDKEDQTTTHPHSHDERANVPASTTERERQRGKATSKSSPPRAQTLAAVCAVSSLRRIRFRAFVIRGRRHHHLCLLQLRKRRRGGEAHRVLLRVSCSPFSRSRIKGREEEEMEQDGERGGHTYHTYAWPSLCPPPPLLAL